MDDSYEPNQLELCREMLRSSLERAEKAEDELQKWRNYEVDDDDLHDLQKQAKGRNGDYKDSLAASGVYIVALEHRLKQAEADSARLRESLWTVGHEASRLREALEWISVFQRLPDESGLYMVYYQQDAAYGSQYYNAHDGQFSGMWENSRVTHWRRLPEPPEEQP